MKTLKKIECHLLMVFALAACLAVFTVSSEAEGPSSPVALAAEANGQRLFVAESSVNAIALIDLQADKVSKRITLPEMPSGLALSPDAATLYVTNGAPSGKVLCVNVATGDVSSTIAVGHTPLSPVLSPDGNTLYVCNRFNNDVSVIDVPSAKELARIPAVREPSAAALTPNGKTLFVANLLPSGPADGDFIAAAVTAIDTDTKQVRATTLLPNGSSGLRGICISPDGRFVYVAHTLARYQLPTTQLERGWMNTNALSILDAESGALVNAVLLDDVELGAANPWGVACTQDGKYVCVAHAGTHELSIIDRAALHAKLDKVAAGEPVSEVASTSADVPNDLSFLTGLRRRVKLAGIGPRALLIVGSKAYAAEYFSDSISIANVSEDPMSAVRSIALAPESDQTSERRGEMFFNDARMCFQQWQSCASCHPDARVDAFNWDLLNDGIGNPKSTKNMLLAHATPPTMSLGVRDSAEYAVRSGMRFIQFAIRPEEDALKIDAYLKSLKPVPSPLAPDGQLSASALRGKDLFTRAGCVTCHSGELYTDLKQYNIGTGKGMDEGKAFDTPALVEVWRTAPYLSDGRAATMNEVLKKYNPEDRHGVTKSLSDDEIHDLETYILSL